MSVSNTALWMSPQAFIDLYAEKNDESVAEARSDLVPLLEEQLRKFRPRGWFMGECEQLDSSHLGEITILPFGGKATHQQLPSEIYSPRGLASDMSRLLAWMSASDFRWELIAITRKIAESRVE